MFSQLRPMSKSRSLAEMSERRLQPLLVEKLLSESCVLALYYRAKGGDIAP